jgi:hypothetical protein
MTGNNKKRKPREYSPTEQNTTGSHPSRTSSINEGDPDSEDDDEETETDIKQVDAVIEDSNEEANESEDQESVKKLDQSIETGLVPCPSLSVEDTGVSVTSSIELAESNKENPWSTSIAEISANTSTERVQNVIEPASNDTDTLEVTMVAVSTNQLSRTVTNHYKPTGKSTMQVTAPASLQLTQQSVRVEQSDQTATQTNAAVTELKEILEFEGWETDDAEAGTPLSRRRPQVVIHKQPHDEPDSFEYLCRVLRDYYTLIEGGEPTVSAVEFVSNRPRIPPLSNQILRLDMTGNEWDLEAGADRVYTRRENTDILPKLATVSQTQFAGSLGFLVINIPAQAGQSPFATDGISTQVYNYLTDTIGNETNQNTTVIHTSPSSNRASWGAIMSEYLGFEIDAGGLTVKGVEDQYFERVEQPDWHAVALTERQQDNDNESDRHYLYKSAIANSIGWITYNNTDNQDYDTYRKFLSEVASNHILTEESPNDGLSGNPEADIFIDWSEWNGYTANLLEMFVDDDDTEWDMVDQMAIEFETGRAEGAFEFRKIHETIEKYDQTGVDLVAVVTSPWIVEIDRIRRGQHSQIERLVEQKNRVSDEQEFRTYIPKFDTDGCSGLESITGGTHDE